MTKPDPLTTYIDAANRLLVSPLEAEMRGGAGGWPQPGQHRNFNVTKQKEADDGRE